jgi:hypothetical protein
MHRFTPWLAAFMLACAGTARADAGHRHGIHSPAGQGVHPAFDIVHTKITTEGNVALFHVAVSGRAGQSHPTRTGKLAGSTIFSYVSGALP